MTNEPNNKPAQGLSEKELEGVVEGTEGGNGFYRDSNLSYQYESREK